MEKELRAKVQELVARWKELNALLEEDKDFSRETFEKLFDETYDVIAPLSTLTEISKEYMTLIMEMRNFIICRHPGQGREYVAALVLTERFMYHCVVRPAAYVERVECASIYAMESREDILLDFTKVNEAIDVLIEALAE